MTSTSATFVTYLIVECFIAGIALIRCAASDAVACPLPSCVQRQAKEAAEAAATAAGVPPSLAPLLALPDKTERRERLKEAMAVAANKLLEGPEAHVGELRVS